MERENPDRLFIMPSDADMQQEGLALGKEAFNKAQALERRRRFRVVGFAGSLAGAGLDPWNVASMPFGGPGSFVRASSCRGWHWFTPALGSGRLPTAYRQQINPQYLVGDAVTGALRRRGAGRAGNQHRRRRARAGVAVQPQPAAVDPFARDAGNVTMGDALNDVRAAIRSRPARGQSRR